VDDVGQPESNAPESFGSEEWFATAPAMDLNNPSLTSAQQRPPRRRRFVVAAASVMVGVTVTVGVVIGLGGPGSNDAAAFVATGAKATLSQRTADLVISGSISVSGQNITLSGNGAADLSSSLVDLNVSATIQGQTLQEQELFANPTTYLTFSLGGKNPVSTLFPGKQWVQMPLSVPAGQGAGLGASNPLSQLQMLAQQGNVVTALGPSTINGIAVNGYKVVISRQAMLNASKRLVASGDLSSFGKQAILQAASQMTPPVLSVWFDSDNLLRRQSVSINLTTSGATTSGNVTIDFVHYGAPVAVVIPATSNVVSYNAFLAAAQAANG
jgi:hypothetical protein